MRVLCYGDRNWSDMGVIKRELSALPAGTVVMHGGCVGADTMAGYVAKALGFEVKVFPVVRGVIGPLRNQQFLDEGKPDIVLIFHTDMWRHRGTAHLHQLACAAGTPVHLITS